MKNLTKSQLYKIAKKYKHVHKKPISSMTKAQLQKLVSDLSKHHQHGAGVLDDIKRFGNKVKDLGKKAIDKIKEVFFFPPNRLPGNSEKIFNKYKGDKVISIEVRREPLQSAISKVANWISKGEYDKKLKELGYDKAFHLYMLVRLSSGKQLLIEKNERINITDNASKGIDSESITISLGGYSPTLDQFLNKAREQMGDHKFFQYNARDNNCQDFLLGILQANELLDPEVTKFIKQDSKSIFESLPGWASSVAQFITDTSGKVNQVINGGKRKKRKVTKRKTKKTIR